MAWLIDRNARTIRNTDEPDSVFELSAVPERCTSSEFDAGNTRVAFDVEGLGNVRVFVFEHKLSRNIKRRITSMQDVLLSDLSRKNFAWPRDLVVDGGGKLVGYTSVFPPDLEPLSKRPEVFNLWPRSRRLRIASNLCVALDAFHGYGFVFGCLDLSRVYLDGQTGRVFLDPGIDVQIGDGKKRLTTCAFGLPEFVAPETQERALQWSRKPARQRKGKKGEGKKGKGKKGEGENKPINPPIPYDVDDDLFSAGVILFLLISGGLHPLSYRYNGSERISLGHCLGSNAGGVVLTNEDMFRKPPSSMIRSPRVSHRNYLMRRFRGAHAGEVFDACFSRRGFADSRPRPSLDEWSDLIDRLEKRPFAQRPEVTKWRLPKVARATFSFAPPATPTERRKELLEQYPQDLPGSELIASPRVFWRTTMLFSVAMGLFAAATAAGEGALSSLGVFSGGGNPWLVVGGTLLATVVANALVGLRRATGYAPVHYVASVLVTFAVGLLLGLWG